MLWIIYSSSFDTEEDNPAKRMYNEALNYNIESQLMFYQYFDIINDELFYKNKKIEVFPNIAFLRCHELELAIFLENNNVKVVNSSFTIKSCRDKLITHKLVAQTNVEQIPTIKLDDLEYNEIVYALGSPFVLKYRHGSQGNFIYLISNEHEFYNIIEKVNRDDYIVQKYIATSYGKDIRVYIVGKEVVGAVKRVNTNGFMSNLAQGGLSYKFDLNERLISDSLKIKEVLKGDIISVDYVFSENGLLFCEANTNAGFASFNYLGYPMRKIFMEYFRLLNKEDILDD